MSCKFYELSWDPQLSLKVYSWVKQPKTQQKCCISILLTSLFMAGHDRSVHCTAYTKRVERKDERDYKCVLVEIGHMYLKNGNKIAVLV